jgi:DNA ligase (NAD+)
VVPRLEAPLVALRDGTQTEIVPPIVCPVCGGPIDKSQERWRCASGRVCGLVPSLAYAVARDALDIEGLATAQITALVESGAVSSLADLFTLTEDVLVAAGVPRTSGGVPIVDRIAAAKNAPFGRVLTSLSIQGTGRSASRSLAAKYRTMAGLRAATVTQLADTVVSVNRLGMAKAELIVEELATLSDTIDAMAVAGVNMGPDTEPAGTTQASDKALPLAGKVVVVTGTMVSRSRTEMEDLVRTAGGRAGSSVSKSTDILVAGPGAGSKLQKAVSLGVPVMSEDEFLAKCVDVS